MKMFIKLNPQIHPRLSICWLLLFGLGLISCTMAQNEVVTPITRLALTSFPAETPVKPSTSMPTVSVDILPIEEPQETTPTAVPTPTATKAITTPTLINIEVPLKTENLPAYGWFSDDSQVAYFAYPEEGVTLSYDIATQQLISTTLSQKSSDQLIEQITADLPPDARVVEVSPKYQNVLFTVPLSQPVTIELPSYSLEVYDELWLYKDGGSIRLGVVDRCFQLHLTHDILWSSSENLATVFAISPMDCAWSNWLVDLEEYTVGPVSQTWEEELPAYKVAAILPNKQLLLTALLRDEPSAILDFQTGELTLFSNQGDEIVGHNDAAVFLDFLFRLSRDETEILFSPVNETNWQLIDVTEGEIRAKYVSPDQKHVLLFSGSPDYYGLSENQKTSGVWLLSFP